MSSRKSTTVYYRIRQILESARAGVARSVNTTQVVANWLVGREIVEDEQRGKKRAGYGKQLLRDLSSRLTAQFGTGYSVDNLEMFRRFFLEYSSLLADTKSDALRRILPSLPNSRAVRSQSTSETTGEIHHSLSGKSDALRRKSSITALTKIGHAVRDQSWEPGRLHPNLAWTHYRTLLRLEKPQARAFYEIEALKNNWSARELERRKIACCTNGWLLAKTKRG